MPFSFLEVIAASPSKSFRLWVGAFLMGLALVRAPLVLAAVIAGVMLVAAFRPHARRLLAVALVVLILGAVRPALAPVSLPVPANALARIRAHTVSQMRRAWPGPEAALLAGMSIGDTTGMPQWMKLRFRKTGTTHLLAVSGANLTIAAGALVPLLFLLGLRREAVAVGAAAGIASFAVFTGGQPPVVRAAAMALLVLLAREAGRTPDRANLLLAAGAVMLAFDPALRDSISFLLSLSATAGLLWFSPLFAARFDAMRGVRRAPEVLRQSVADGLSALFTTLPITVGSFGNFSAVALPANMVAAPFVPLLTLGGGLLAVVSSVLPPLAALLAFPLAAVARILLWLLALCALAPGAYLMNGGFPPAAAVAWYAGLVFLARRASLSAPQHARTLSPHRAS